MTEREKRNGGRHGSEKRREGERRRDVVPTGNALAHERDLALKDRWQEGKLGSVRTYICVFERARGNRHGAELRQRDLM